MPKVYYAAGQGSQLAELLGADDSIRNQIPGDVHLVSIDGEVFIPFYRRPQAGDYEKLDALRTDESDARPLEFPRGIVESATEGIEQIEL